MIKQVCVLMTDEIIPDPHLRRVAAGNLGEAARILEDTAKQISELGILHPSEKQNALMIFITKTKIDILKHAVQIADIDGFVPEIIYVDDNEA